MKGQNLFGRKLKVIIAEGSLGLANAKNSFNLRSKPVWRGSAGDHSCGVDQKIDRAHFLKEIKFDPWHRLYRSK